MKCFKLMLLIVGAALLVSGCAKDDLLVPGPGPDNQAESSLKAAKKPAAKLVGIMELDFNRDILEVPPPPEPVPVWEGTIDFGEPYGKHGMRFFNLGGEGNVNSKASPFEEIFEIYELVGGEAGAIVLAGHDEGVTTLANSKYRMNGVVDIVANLPFDMWLGRKVHMSGDITWENIGTEEDPIIVPATAPGIFRIN